MHALKQEMVAVLIVKSAQELIIGTEKNKNINKRERHFGKKKPFIKSLKLPNLLYHKQSLFQSQCLSRCLCDLKLTAEFDDCLLIKMTTQTTKSKPMYCYTVCDAKDIISPHAKTSLLKFREYTTYYQTFGGGPEGGYFIKYIPPADDDGDWVFAGCWSVERTWGEPFSAVKMSLVAGFRYNSETQELILLNKLRTRITLNNQWRQATLNA